MLMSIFIAVIMVVSVIGFALTFGQPAAERLEYNSYKFLRTQQGLQAKINDIKVYFYYFPRDLEDIPFEEGAKTAVDGARVLWFTYDPNDQFTREIADVLYYMEDALATVSDVYVQRGLLNTTGYTLPQITCANATVTVPVLVLQSGNETAIGHNNGCITATAATDREVYQVGDRLLYQAFGVMR
jgi:hypothetical protein